jgi:hypothetical protein
MSTLRAAIAALLVYSFSLSAQEYRGRVQGSVTDSTEAAIAGASVTLTNVQTGVVSTRETNESGRYLFDLVLPGTYTVAVQFTGFTRFVQEKVVLVSRGDITVDAVLKPGDIREAVTVTDQASTVQFNTSKLETTVDSSLVSNLPRATLRAKSSPISPGPEIDSRSAAGATIPTTCRLTAARSESAIRRATCPRPTPSRKSLCSKTL